MYNHSKKTGSAFFSIKAISQVIDDDNKTFGVFVYE